jgi:hypothetical protein
VKNASLPFSDKVRKKAVKMLSDLAGNSLSLNYNVTTTTRQVLRCARPRVFGDLTF